MLKDGKKFKSEEELYNFVNDGYAFPKYSKKSVKSAFKSLSEDFYAKGGKISDLIVGNKVGHLRPHTGRYEYSEITEINGDEVKLVHRHPTKRYWDNYFEMDKDQIEEFIDTPSKDFKDGRPLMKIKKVYAKGGEVYRVSGYWKDDGSEFNDYLISEYDDVPKGYDDDDIFLLWIKRR